MKVDYALHDLRWETLKNRREQHVLKLVKKCVKGVVPQFLCDYFSFKYSKNYPPKQFIASAKS